MPIKIIDGVVANTDEERPEQSPWFRCKRGTWIGPREETSDNGCCPHCGSQVELIIIDNHWRDAEAVENGNYEWPPYKLAKQPSDWSPHRHPEFLKMWQWARQQNKCFKDVTEMRNGFEAYTGTHVDIEP